MTQATRIEAARRALRLAMKFARKGDHGNAQQARVLARQLLAQGE